MENLVVISEMRTNLSYMNKCLTPDSTVAEYQRYLNSLLHYKKIINACMTRLIIEVDESIDKSNKNLRGFAIDKVNNIIDG
jgi:hypothetical protein